MRQTLQGDVDQMILSMQMVEGYHVDSRDVLFWKKLREYRVINNDSGKVLQNLCVETWSLR